MNLPVLPRDLASRRKFLEQTFSASTIAALTTGLSAATPANAEEKSGAQIMATVPPEVNITDPAYAGGADPSGVASCVPALTLALAAGSELVIPPGTYLIASNFTIPRGKCMRLSAGAIFKVSAGVTFTIRGEVFAPHSIQIFIAQSNGSSGTVTGLRQVWPEWWGAKGDGVTDDLTALNAAHNSVYNSLPSDGERPTIFLTRAYAISGPWLITPKQSIGIKVTGCGWNNTAIVTAANFPLSPVVRIMGQASDYNANWELSNLRIGPGGSGPGLATVGLLVGSYNPALYLNGYHDNLVENIMITGFPTCLEQCEARLVKYHRCSFWNPSLTVANYLVKVTERGNFCGDITFADCQFVGSKDHTVAGMLMEAVNGGIIAGVRLRGVIGYTSQKYLYLRALSDGAVADVWVDGGTQFDADCVNCIVMQSEGTGSISDIHLDHVYMTVSSSDSIVLNSVLSGGSYGWIQSIFITHCFIAMGYGRGIVVQNNGGANIQGISLNGNEIWSTFATGVPGIQIRGKAVNCIGNFATTWAPGTFSHFVQIDSGTSNLIVANNNSGGLATMGPVLDSSGAVVKVVNGNI